MANKYFVDTDVLLDLIADRAPFSDAASQLFDLCDQGKLHLCTSTLCLNNLHYIIRKMIGEKAARHAIAELMAMLEVLPVAKNNLSESVESPFSDFEDAVQHAVAKGDAEVKTIITRNTKDFKKGELAVFAPADFLNLYLSNP
jgi:predicted nucleic acid-binding protein